MRTLGEIQPGQTVGRYEFLVPIAQGGMAAVWAARLKGTRGFSKTVAVKTMLPSISDDPQFEQMFLDEAQICSRIRHPNVVEILDLGEQDDVLYLVMEWVDGEPLSSLRRVAAKAQGIPLPIAVKIIADACAGLHAAHQLKNEGGDLIGLVHRDISPQNILITYSGMVKIVDFGVAKAAGRTAEETSAGQIKGKPPYMSPEQALGSPIDRRTDIFALGIILYQLTTGKHPFRGESDIVTLQNIVSDRPIIAPRAYNKEYPKPLETVVMKALDRDPDKRFQTCAEFEAALDRVFPPTVPRVRTEDVGKFVSGLLGDRGEERRAALREAIRLADERAQGADEVAPAKLRPLAELARQSVSGGTPLSQQTAAIVVPPSAEPSSPVSGRPTLASEHSIATGPLSGPLTPYGTQTPSTPPPARSRGAVWLVAGLLVAGALIGGGVLLTRAHGAVREVDVQAHPAAPAGPHTDEPVKATKTPAQAKSAPEDDAIDPSQLALEKDKPKTEHPGAFHPGAAKPVAKAGKPAASAKPDTPKPPAKNTKPASGGFVPPPMTDPGF